MKYATVCSGIEAPSVAWEPLGWQPQFFSEIEPFPNAVLAHHYPSVPNLGDFTTIKGSKYRGTIDLVCGGTPCQSFSVAGNRAGLDDPRGNLAIEFIKLVDEIRPRWVVWENVPGVLSSWSDAEEEGYETNDFDTFLSLLGQCGYGFAWRILDAQYFGVPQRRRRVFVVGYFGGWAPAASVLFERESLLRHSSPRREAGSDIAATLKGGSGERGFSLDNESGLTLDRIREGVRDHTLTNHPNRQDPSDCTYVIHGTQDPDVSYGVSHPLGTNQGQENAIAYNITFCDSGGVRKDRPNGGLYVNPTDKSGTVTSSTPQYETAVLALAERKRGSDRQLEYQADKSYALTNPGDGGRSSSRLILAPTLSTKNEPANSSSTRDEWYETSAELLNVVRRLTPLECERLQGFPDGYTNICSTTSDSVRYRALGNSMAVPVVRWIGQRLQQVDDLLKSL